MIYYIYIQQRMYKKIIKEDIYSINDISFSLFCLKIIKMIVMIRDVSISFYTYILFFTFLIDDLYHLLHSTTPYYLQEEYI